MESNFAYNSLFADKHTVKLIWLTVVIWARCLCISTSRFCRAKNQFCHFAWISFVSEFPSFSVHCQEDDYFWSEKEKWRLCSPLFSLVFYPHFLHSRRFSMSALTNFDIIYRSISIDLMNDGMLSPHCTNSSILLFSASFFSGLKPPLLTDSVEVHWSFLGSVDNLDRWWLYIIGIAFTSMEIQKNESPGKM